jgi:hypothetical protein
VSSLNGYKREVKDRSWEISFFFPFHPFEPPQFSHFILIPTNLASLDHLHILSPLLDLKFVSTHNQIHSTFKHFFVPTYGCCRLTLPHHIIMAYQQSYYQTTSLPIAVPQKQQYYTPQNHGYAVSPPEVAESVTTGSGMAPSYGNSQYSATSSSYAGSASEYDSTSSANGVDMQEYMQDRFTGAFNPIPLDRTLAVQAQT